jgi:TonB family protein
VHVAGISWPGQRPGLKRPYVTVIVQVDANGKVTAAKVDDSSGNAEYDSAGVKAIERWAFTPAEKGCNAIDATAEYAVGTMPDRTFSDPCNRDVVVVQQAQPEYPDAARNLGLGQRTVSITLGIDPVGRLTKAAITSSSENMALDRAAMAAALQSNYFPAAHGCMPVAGSYTFKVTFDPGS